MSGNDTTLHERAEGLPKVRFGPILAHGGFAIRIRCLLVQAQTPFRVVVVFTYLHLTGFPTATSNYRSNGLEFDAVFADALPCARKLFETTEDGRFQEDYNAWKELDRRLLVGQLDNEDAEMAFARYEKVLRHPFRDSSRTFRPPPCEQWPVAEW